MKSPCPNRMTLEELTRTEVHLILGVREGHGFGFINHPLVVVAGLDGHRLETDIIPPSSDPLFSIELVWEANLKNIRRLRQANTPVKIECFTVVNPQKREKIGYILLNLKQAQIVPHGKKFNIVESWHRLLGVRSEMKASNPEMLLTLRIEDGPDETPQPVKVDRLLNVTKNDPGITNILTPLLFADEDIIQIGPQESCNDVFKLKIKIWVSCNIIFLLPSIKLFVKKSLASDEVFDYFLLKYSVMGYANQSQIDINDLMDKDKDAVISIDDGAVINVRSNLKILRTYFNEFPLIMFQLMASNLEFATTSFQLKGLILTDNILQFRKAKGGKINTRCYLTPSPTVEIGSIKPYIDVSVKITHETSQQLGGFGDMKTTEGEIPKQFHTQGHGDANGPMDNSAIIETILSPRKRTPRTITTATSYTPAPLIPAMDFEKVISSSLQSQSVPTSPKSKFVISNNGQGSCTYRCNNDIVSKASHSFILRVVLNSINFKKLPPDGKFMFSMHHPMAEVVCSVHGDMVAEKVNEKITLPSIEAQFRFASNPDEINNILMAEQPIVSVCDARNRVFASAILHTGILLSSQRSKECVYTASLESESQSITSNTKQQIGLMIVTMTLVDCGMIIKFASNQVISDASPRMDKRVAYRVVEELEDWKERQQELFKNELKKKECQHLTMLSSEWTKRRMELEDNLNRNVEQCRTLAQSLNEATDNMRERSRKNSEKERALAFAEKELERKYEMKFQELREATNRMEADINHKLSLMKFEKTELLEKIGLMEREKKRLLDNVQTLEKELDTVRTTGLSKEQAANLLQEMKALEEKLDAAHESKMFFKEQWGKAVREIHRLKKDHQLSVQAQLQRERDELYKLQLGNQAKEEEKQMMHDKNILQDLKFEMQELSGQQQNSKQQCKSQPKESPVQPLPASDYQSGSPHLDLNNVQLQRLIDQRDQLLNSGAATNREMLAALNNQIRTLLLQMSA